MNVPIIGSPPRPVAPLRVDVAAVGGTHVQIDLTLLNVDVRRATLDPQGAANVMQQIGMALEEIAPGQLIPQLKAWVHSLESVKMDGQKVLQEMGMVR